MTARYAATIPLATTVITVKDKTKALNKLLKLDSTFR